MKPSTGSYARGALGRRLARPGRVVWLLLALALLVRLGAVVATPDLDVRADSADYHRHAQSIAGGEGYPDSAVTAAGGPTALRPPLYPYFLGLVYSVTDGGAQVARLAQALLGSVTVALLGLIAWQIWGRRTALMVMGLAAVFPPLIAIGMTLLSESLFVPLELGAMAAAIQYRGSRSRYRWLVLAGVLCGLAILTRSTGALLLLPLAIAAWGPGVRPNRRALTAVAVLFLTATLTIAPWTVRNAVVLDSFVPVTSQGGYTFAGVYNEASRTGKYPGAWRVPTADPRYAAIASDPRLDEVALGRELAEEARGFALEHPLYVLEAGYRNAVRLVHLDGGDYARFTARNMGLPGAAIDLSIYSFYVVAVLSLAGASSRAARRAPGFFWLTPVLLLTIVFVNVIFRFRAPIDPFLVVLAALGAASLSDRVASLRGAGPSAAASGLVLHPPLEQHSLPATGGSSSCASA